MLGDGRVVGEGHSAHIAVWRSRAITQMFKAEQGQPPKPKSPPGSGAKAANWLELFDAQEDAAQKDRPLERVMAEFRGRIASL